MGGQYYLAANQAVLPSIYSVPYVSAACAQLRPAHSTIAMFCHHALPPGLQQRVLV